MAKVAVFGLFQNENFFIPYWQNYYGKLFGYENLYAIGDLEKDYAMKLFDSKVEKIHYAPQFNSNFAEHVAIVINMQNQLLQKYETVIFAEADHIFVPNLNKYQNLAEFLDKNSDDYLRVTGYNVFHNILEEPLFDPSLPLLKQRKYWYRFELEDKQLIVRKPMSQYEWGFHNQCVPHVNAHPDLFNIHLHQYDFNNTNSRRFSKTIVGNWHVSAGPTSAGSHTWIQDNKLRDSWYEYPNKYGLQLIPEFLKELL
jgi:hypothetical protein